MIIAGEMVDKRYRAANPSLEMSKEEIRALDAREY